MAGRIAQALGRVAGKDTDVAAAQERLDASLKGGVAALEASAAAARQKVESDKAIAIKDDYVDAMVMKNLLLRQQALIEKSPARQQALLKEANALRDKAIATRARLQGEADAAEAKAKAAKDTKSE